MVMWMQLDRACFRTHGDTCCYCIHGSALAKNPRSWAHPSTSVSATMCSNITSRYWYPMVFPLFHEYPISIISQIWVVCTHTHIYIYIVYITQWFAAYLFYPLIDGILPWLPRFGTLCTTDPSFSRKAPANPDTDGDMPCATSKISNWYHIYIYYIIIYIYIYIYYLFYYLLYIYILYTYVYYIYMYIIYMYIYYIYYSETIYAMQSVCMI